MNLLLLVVFSGIVNSHYSCMTWILNGNNLSLICRIQTHNQTVSFRDSHGKLQAKCSFSNLSKCESFHINGSITAHAHQYTVVFMIKEYKDTSFVDEEWSCSQGNTLLKTVVSPSRGTVADTKLILSGILTPILRSVTLRCFSCREPHGNNAEFFKDDKSEDSIRYNTVTNKCTHIMGECRPEACSCSPSGNEFMRNFPVTEEYIKFSCAMKFVDNETSSRYLKVSSVILKGNELIYNHSETTNTIHTDNGQQVNDGKRNASDDRNSNRTVSSTNTVKPGEDFKWMVLGLALIISFVVFGVVIVCCRPFTCTKRKKEEDLPLMRTTELLAPKHFDIVQCNDFSITIEWDINDQLKPLTYQMCYRRQPSAGWNTLIICTEDVYAKENRHLLYKLQNLLPLTSYELKMCTVDRHAKSQYTESKTGRTLQIAPKHFNIVQCNDFSITIEWDIKDQVIPLKYEIRYRLQGSDDVHNLTVNTEDVSAKEDGHLLYTIPNLLPGAYYELQMCSINRNVKSQYTNLRTGQTLQIAPDQFNIVHCNVDSITIEWDINGQIIPMVFEIHYRRQGSDDWNVLTVSVKEDRHNLYKIQNLLPATCYELKVCSIDTDVHVKSQYTELRTGLTLQIAPKNFAIVECTDCSITVEWVITDNRQEYELGYRLQGSDKWIYLIIPVSGTEDGRLVYNLQDLSPDACYELKLCSIEKNVKSQYTESRTQQTLKLYEIDSFKSDETEEFGLESIRISPHIWDLKENYNAIQGNTRCENNVENITKTNGTETLQERDPISVFSPGVINSPDIFDGDVHLSNVLKARGETLSFVKLRRNGQCYAYNIHNILNDSQNGLEFIFSGSKADGLSMQLGQQNERLYSRDKEVIMIDNGYTVCENKTEMGIVASSNPTQGLLLRLADDTGYAKLVCFHIRTELIKFCEFQGSYVFLKNSVKDKIFAAAFSKHHLTKIGVHGRESNPEYNTNRLINNPGEDSLKEWAVIAKTINNMVFCIGAKKWPIEASEWIKRTRSSNWPSHELFANILKSGYSLAASGNKESKDSVLQWRISFYRAERLIIESYNETQIHCYNLLYLLKKARLSKVAAKNITSYTIKTVMFWCLDEISQEVWQPSNLLSCFCFCLSKLKSFVEIGFLPNYFIRKRNLFISCKFTRELTINVAQFLHGFLADPKGNISGLLSFYNIQQNVSRLSLTDMDRERFIKEWLWIRISMAEKYHETGKQSYSILYDGYNINKIVSRCKRVLENLTKISYAQPLIKLLQNCICVLQYIILMKDKKTPEISSETQRKCLEYMKLSLGADRTHTTLRIATCLLDNGAKDCIDMIHLVTNHPDSHLYMKNYSQYVKEKLPKPIGKAYNEMFKTIKISEIPIYTKIIEQDLIYQDPYRTIELFKSHKAYGCLVNLHYEFLLLWDCCWFDVTFMPAEMHVLPKPAALEICTDKRRKKISFHPFLYGLLLEFLWHVRYTSPNEERKNSLAKMKRCVQFIPEDQQSIGLNFVAYCCSIQDDSISASRYLIHSFKLNPVEQNVAYLYIKYIINILRSLSYDDDHVLYSRHEH